METEIRARHRVGGRHSDVLLALPPHTKPSGRRSAARKDNVVVPPRPDHMPTVHQPVIERDHGKHRQEDTAGVMIVGADADARVPVNTGPLKTVKPTRSNRGAHKIAVIATGGLLLATAGISGAVMKTPNKTTTATSQLSVIDVDDGQTDLELENTGPITAPSSVILAADEVEVTTEAAVVIPEPEPEIVPEPVIAPAPVPSVVAAAPTVAAPVNPVVTGKSQTIAAAALGQIGVYQDCTMLVTNSLAAAGISHHGWPISYYSLGYAVSAAEAVPGDLIYYVYGSAPGTLAHIAVYIGNGQAVHGGWNGNETRIFSVNVGSGPQFIRVA